MVPGRQRTLFRSSPTDNKAKIISENLNYGDLEWMPPPFVFKRTHIQFTGLVMMISNRYSMLPIGLVFLFFHFLVGSAHAVNQVVLDADSQFAYAELCYAHGDYETAIAEYKRFMHFFPEDTRVEKAMFAAAMSDYHRKRFQEAIAAFTECENRFPDTPLSIRAAFMISKCYLELMDTGNAIVTLNNLLAQADDDNVRDEAFHAMGWIYTERGEFEKARSFFKKISLKNQSVYETEILSKELEKNVSIPQKSPRVAGFLSILPGGGYFYCERYQDALVAFLLNGALIAASWEAFDQGNPALGGVIAAVEFGFYAGNIYGGIASAHKYNTLKTHNFIETLKEKSQIGISGATGGLQLSVQIPF